MEENNSEAPQVIITDDFEEVVETYPPVESINAGE